jgi:hypothetical protein
MLAKIADLNFIIKGASNNDYYSVYPILNTSETIIELFRMNFISYKDVLVYIYIWHPDKEKLIVGKICTCYNSWFLIKELPINNLQELDFLYTIDHSENLENEKSMGIIYKMV